MEIPYGTLELLVLKTLETLGRPPRLQHRAPHRAGVGADDAHQPGVNYPALIRLEQQGLISTTWGLSETNRKVKFYALTEAGTKQLQVEVEKWERAAGSSRA